MNFSTLHIKGLDAATFIQGQITSDIHNLLIPEHFTKDQDLYPHSGLAGMCNNKGRLITLFWAEKISDEHISLCHPSELSEIIMAHLKRFVFRAKINFEITESNEIKTMPSFNSIPWITLASSSQFTPQMINLDCLNGISFKKGCYTGQEIVARLHYLGKNKRRMLGLTLDTDHPLFTTPETLMAIKDAIMSQSSPHGEPHRVGEIVYITDSTIFASLQVSDIFMQLSCNNVPLLIQPLPYEVPEFHETNNL